MHAPRLLARLRHMPRPAPRKPIDAPRLLARLRHMRPAAACRELADLALETGLILEAPAGQAG